MKVYRGKLTESAANLIKASGFRVAQLLDTKQGLNAPEGKTYTIEESVEKYNSTLSLDEIKAWVWYRRKSGIPMYSWSKYFVNDTKKLLFEWVNKGVLFIENENYVPFAIFTFGNIYAKLNIVQKNKDFIITNFGQSVYDNHIEILNKAKPKPISISNPVESERPVILAISKFASNFKIESLRSSTGVILENAETLKEAFKDYLRTLSDEQLGKSNSRYITNYYLNAESKPRNIDKVEWRTIQKNSRDEGERLFKQFLHEAIEHKDQIKIDAEYNMNFNAVSSLNYNKVPIGLEVSKTFHGHNLEVRPAQREGIAFMELVGSGIIAYDVGVGKTITAIIELAAAIKNGKCKRPLVCVPNPTYKNWIKEMFGFDGKAGILTGTGIKLNEWYNLGAGYDDKIDFEKAVPENTITLVTYEGFQKLGFSPEQNEKQFNELSNILSQSTTKSERDQEKEYEKYRSIIGVGQKGTIADFDTLKFDYLVVDEAHNFKNIFNEVKSDDKDDPKKRFHVKGGSPSSRGVKAFFICNYIQRTYGRNIMLLTATPFTNSPLEIYSMLSLVAYDYMKKGNIFNIRDFFEQYILETSEYVVGTDGEIKQKDVVKSFNNRISLQKLINSHINFKTGEEANIPRPCKINLPKTTTQNDKGEIIRLKQDNQITTYLKLNDEQQQYQKMINAEASKPVSKDDPGKQLRLMSASLNNALSPFLYDKTIPLDYKEFVDNSPKIKYTVDCIATVKKWHEQKKTEITGQVIYMDRGKQFFPLLKEYLEKELGYKKGVSLNSNPRLKVDEVEVISSGISGAKKEKIKNAFNDGSCKIIIGTSTIKEGINLQKKSTCLYNLYPNWNPTDIRQLEGRIWRQKNENGYVRIVMPLMENSMDVFVFQKLEEKTSRINDLWSKSDRGNVLNEEALDPNEIKFALVTDLGVLTRFEIKQIQDELRRKEVVLNANLEALKDYANLKSTYETQRENIETKLENAYGRIGNVELFYSNSLEKRIYYGNVKDYNREKDFNKTEIARIEAVEKNIAKIEEYVNADVKTDVLLIRGYAAKNRLFTSYGYGSDWDFDRFKDTVSRFGKIKRTVFDQRGYSESTDISKISLEMEKEAALLDTEIEEAKGQEFYDKIFSIVAEKKAKLNLKGGNLQQKVVEFSSLNYLLSYKFKDVDHTSCEIPRVENKNYKSGSSDKSKRIRIARAKAKAIKIKLMLSA
ncbi:SNF2-related protein [Polaribacter aestuariivivens]|uniref:SNF2-related protein n=1 Tax=Polaribacter aestuariivivens TaxID=2304626 RepID=UPI003F4989FF